MRFLQQYSQTWVKEIPHHSCTLTNRQGYLCSGYHASYSKVPRHPGFSIGRDQNDYGMWRNTLLIVRGKRVFPLLPMTCIVCLDLRLCEDQVPMPFSHTPGFSI